MPKSVLLHSPVETTSAFDAGPSLFLISRLVSPELQYANCANRKRLVTRRGAVWLGELNQRARRDFDAMSSEVVGNTSGRQLLHEHDGALPDPTLPESGHCH